MEVYEVFLTNLSSREELSTQVEVDEAETTEEFVIRAVINGQEITTSSDSYLPAYQKFRDKLLATGYGIKCNGSRINAIQSGMMGNCEKIYLVNPGRQATFDQIVSMWGYADIDDFPDTKTQLEYADKWFDPKNR